MTHCRSFVNTSENTIKRSSKKAIKTRNNLRISENWLRLGINLQPKGYETHALTTHPRTLIKSQTLTKNKAEDRCYKISYHTDRDYIKKATK